MWSACDGLAGTNCWPDLCFVSLPLSQLCVYINSWTVVGLHIALLHQHEWSGLEFSCRESRAVFNCKCYNLSWRICVTAVSLSRWVWLKKLYHHQPPFLPPLFPALFSPTSLPSLALPLPLSPFFSPLPSPSPPPPPPLSSHRRALTLLWKKKNSLMLWRWPTRMTR